MQRTDVQRLGGAVLALLLFAAAGHAQTPPSGPDTVVRPPSTTHGGDGVGGIEKTAGQPAGPAGTNSPATGSGATFGQVVGEEPTWTDLGGTLPADGAATLAAAGGTAGSDLVLEASGLVAHAPATLVLGTSVANLPFKGGTLVPAPELLLSGLVLDAQGGLLLTATLPEELPSGLTLCLQLWSADPAGPKGFAATNALLITLP